jgi:hypothetical protein
MASEHKVKQGEHLYKIARQYRFGDYRPIWNHAKNADLVKLRKTPNILFPDDVVFIPDKQPKTETAQTEQVHKFRLSAPPLKLRIRIENFDNQPVPNADCELEVGGQVYKLKSNAQGLVEHEIPVVAEEAKLRVLSLEIEIPLKIGYLDPFDKESGMKARLMNLGYHNGEDDPLRWRYAIEEFQCDHGIKKTGEFDNATRDKLKAEYGC